MSLDYANAPRYAKSRELYQAACQVIPSGVNSTARAVWSGWDPHPLFVAEGRGSRLEDVDGNVYIDYLLGLGPMILGHRPPKVTAAVVDFIQNNGTVFALPHAEETRLTRKMIAAVPSLEQLRLCNTGTEAVLYAVRLARAFTGRNKVIRFEGMYHGFSDGVYWSKHPSLNMAGPDSAPVPVPQGPGLPAGIGDSLIILPWNDAALLREVLEREGHDIAAVITEPVMCNTGCILPDARLSRGHARADGQAWRAAGLRRGDHRLPHRLRRRPGPLRHHPGSLDLRQGHGRRFPRRRPGRAQGCHGAGRRRHGLHGRHLQRQWHRGGRRQCRSRRTGRARQI